MLSTLQSTPTSSAEDTALLNPFDVIDRMIELRLQLQALENQLASLQPTFFAACLSLDADKIERNRAIITRRLTPGQWIYSIDVVEQEGFLKQLKKQFQQDHEPIGGRDVTWAIKLLLMST